MSDTFIDESDPGALVGEPPVIVEPAPADESDEYPSWIPDGFHLEVRTLVSNGENSVVLGPFDSADEAVTVSAQFPTVDRIEVLYAFVRDTPYIDPFDADAEGAVDPDTFHDDPTD